jgi:hypothetical protein
MGAPAFPRRTIEDTMVDLIRAAETLAGNRAAADRIVAELEARWAMNRAACILDAGETGADTDRRKPPR